MYSSEAEPSIQSKAFTSPTSPKKLTGSVVLATFSACLGAISVGYVLGYPSPVQKTLRETFSWSNDEVTWFSSIPGLGAMLGALVGGKTIERFGRKWNLMMFSFPFVLGWILVAVGKASSLLYIGRVISGTGVGAFTLTVPLYIAEISPAKYRGLLGSANQLGITFGTLIAYVLGAVVEDWRWVTLAGGIFPTLTAISMMAMPETPRWLIKNGRTAEACRILVSLREVSSEECEQECKEIQDTLENDEPFSFSEIKKPTVYRPLIIGVMIMVFQQFGGINTVITYSSDMVSKAGISNSNVAAITVAVVQFVFTGVSCVVVDKLGRRKLLIFPGLLMCVCMVVLGFSQLYSGFPSSITLICLSLYIVAFSLGWGPIPWVIMSEIFPTNVRGAASALTTQVNWLGCFTVIKTFVDLKHAFHPYGAYWFYAAVCLLSAIYVFLFLPETKGKVLEEIEALFSGTHDKRRGGSMRGYGALRS